MKIKKAQLAFGVMLTIFSVIQIINYKHSGYIDAFNIGQATGAAADFYYYIFILILAVGIILSLLSLRRK